MLVAQFRAACIITSSSIRGCLPPLEISRCVEIEKRTGGRRRKGCSIELEVSLLPENRANNSDALIALRKFVENGKSIACIYIQYMCVYVYGRYTCKSTAIIHGTRAFNTRIEIPLAGRNCFRSIRESSVVLFALISLWIVSYRRTLSAQANSTGYIYTHTHISAYCDVQPEAIIEITRPLYRRIDRILNDLLHVAQCAL